MVEDENGQRVASTRIAEEAERRTGALDLGGLGLTSLPPQLFEPRHLRELNLGLGMPTFGFYDGADPAFCPNRIADEIGSLGRLPDLRSLSVSFTDLGTLEGMVAFQHMSWFDCSVTQVADLAPLAGLAALRRLICSDCRLASNPIAIWRMTSLEGLILHACHIPGVPAEALSQEPFDNCLNLLRAHLDDLGAGAVAAPDVKLLVLGNGRAGKTQVVRCLRDMPFDERWDSTHGVQVATAMLPSAGGQDEIRLHVWDFGGQDIYHGTHALFVRTPAVTLLVWSKDTNNADAYEHDGLSFRNHPLPYWVEYAHHQGHEDSPLLIVQNKCDTAADEVVRFPVSSECLEGLCYCRELRYSARTDRGRAALEEALRDTVAWLGDPERLGTPTIGVGRLRVQRRLEAMRDADAALPPEQRRHRTFTQEEFGRICAEEGGVSSPRQLLFYLNNTGTVFYREGLFGDRMILDQAWALDAIYAVFQRRDCYCQLLWTRGRFTRSMLALLVWNKRSVEEQKLLLGMMVSCGICFVHREAGDDTKYVAPDLLPARKEVEAELAEKWPTDAATESLTFTYPLLHAGLMREVTSQIGGRAGVNALYWGGGVCVYEAETRSRALIEQEMENELQGRVRLQAQGGQAAELLRRLARLVETAQERLGLRPTEVTPMTPREPPATEPPPLDFRQPPVPEPEWFVSYAWGDNTPEGRERDAVVDRLCAEAEARGTRILRDKNVLGLGDRISRFMQRIGRGDRVFVVLSETYLRSPYCMFELHEVWRTSRQEGDAFLDRVRVYALPDARFDTPALRVGHAVHWKKQHAELEALVREHGSDVLGESDFKRLRLMGEFYRDVSEILATMADIVRPRTFEELARYGLDDQPGSATAK
jgi:internalin A